MPNIQLKEGKVYYSISEVAEMFNVNASHLRFWEKEFDILKPKKMLSGNRKYTPKDIEALQLIYHLVKERKFTLEGAKEKIKKNRNQEQTTMDAIHKLNHIKAQLLEWKGML